MSSRARQSASTPTRPFGRSGEPVSMLALGGYHNVEPAGVHRRLRHRLAGGAPTQPAHRPRLYRDERARTAAYERRLAEPAADGRFELYKTSAEHEGDEGRAQHGFPSQAEMAS